MNTNQGRIAGDVAHFQDDRFLHDTAGMAFKPEDAKLPEAAWKIGFSNLAEFKCRGGGGGGGDGD